MVNYKSFCSLIILQDVFDGGMVGSFHRILLGFILASGPVFGAQLPQTCPVSRLAAVDERGTEPASQTISEFVAGIQQELGMTNHCIEVRKFSLGAILAERTGVMVVGSHHLFVDEKWFSQLPLEQKRFVIGHELIHLRNRHIDKVFAGVTVGAAVVTAICAGTAYRFQQLWPCLRNIQALLSAASLIVGVGAGAYCYGFLRRHYEKEADLNAARELNCAEAAADLFSRNDKQQQKVVTKDTAEKESLLSKLKRNFDELVREHPHRAERAAYLGALAATAA